MKAPQIILIALYAVSLLLNARMHGKPKEGEYNFFAAAITTAIIFGLLIWGGFFG